MIVVSISVWLKTRPEKLSVPNCLNLKIEKKKKRKTVKYLMNFEDINAKEFTITA